MEWDRVRIFPAVARSGQMLAAAKSLGLGGTMSAIEKTGLVLALLCLVPPSAFAGPVTAPPGAALMQSLKLAGVAPSSVTDVLITHAHGDHLGGLANGDHTLAFPNAAIRMSSREWAFVQAQNAAWAKILGPKVVTFEPGAEILPGITPVALYGHTPGHVGYEIVSGNARIEDIGDIAHSSIVSLADPQWLGEMDQDRKTGVATRTAELARLAKAHELVFAPHFPFPGVGWIVPKGDVYAWVPDTKVGQ
jgi:glyoxylase-like metal-dependent hydrolase (beta-lactamase superfamily II)